MNGERKNDNIKNGGSRGSIQSMKTSSSLSDVAKINIDINQVDHSIVALTNDDVLALEQYRSLRTKVLKMARLPDKNTIMITSSSSGEGKTITAINLALTIVKGVQENVLLIDCDLRCPDIYNKLGFKTKYGLSHYLQGQADLETIIYKTNIPKLSIISAGESMSMSPELLASERMAQLILETKSRYNDRYIIFDVPPIIPVTDPCVLADQMDWTIFVIQAGQTQRDTVTSAIAQLDREKVLGIVVNNVNYMPLEYRQSYRKGAKYGYYRF